MLKNLSKDAYTTTIYLSEKNFIKTTQKQSFKLYVFISIHIKLTISPVKRITYITFFLTNPSYGQSLTTDQLLLYALKYIFSNNQTPLLFSTYELHNTMSKSR